MTAASSAFPTGVAHRLRRLNWVAILITLVVEGVMLAALVSLGVVSIAKSPKRELAVLDLRAPIEPPPVQETPKEPEDDAQPTPPAHPRTEIVVPPPEVQAPTASQPTVVAAATPPPVVPSAIAAPAQPSSPPTASAGPGPLSVSNLNTNLLNGIPPVYPVASRRKREQGTVVLRLLISEEGRVMDISIHRSSGFPALDEAAVAAVRKWRWSPTVRDGRKIQITGLVQIPFILKES